MNFKKKALLAGLFTIAASSVAYAAYKPTHHVEIDYYSDASKTVYVGHVMKSCNGRIKSYGKITKFASEEFRVPCKRNGDL